MSPESPDLPSEPTIAEIEASTGPTLLEFGASWCVHCRALAPGLASLLRDHPEVLHIRVEDGPGRPLGRSFRVKLWPTLVFLKDGKVARQLVRPSVAQVREGFDAIIEAC